MKKITKILGLLAIAATLFIGCSNGNDSKSSQSIELSDGNWTFKTKITADEMPEVVTYTTLHATVSGGNINFTSGTMDIEEALSDFGWADLSDEEIEAQVASLNANPPAQLRGSTVFYDKTSNTLYVCTPMTASQLSQFSNQDFSDIPSSVKISSNEAKTHYSFTITEDGYTAVYNITKDE